MQCCRVRTATVQVISALIQEGADPNALMNVSLPSGNIVAITPLHLVLQAGAQASSPQSDHAVEAGTFGDDSVLNSSMVSVASGHGSSMPSRMRSSGARSWVKAAHALVAAGDDRHNCHTTCTDMTARIYFTCAGATWNSSMQIAKGQTQLYLLLKSFPPPRDDMHTYRSLLAACLASCSKENATPLTEDEQGRSALFVLCEQMAGVSQDAYPEASSVLKMVLEYTGGGIGGADRRGRTVFDIEDEEDEGGSSVVTGGHGGGRRVAFSCLRAARQLLVQAGTHKGTHSRVASAAATSGAFTTSESASSSSHRHKATTRAGAVANH
jgi:hypothetical protein